MKNAQTIEVSKNFNEMLGAIEEHLSEAERNANTEWEWVLRTIQLAMHEARTISADGTVTIKLQLRDRGAAEGRQ